MFSIVNKSDKGFDIVALHDINSGTSAEIIPSCGAILHSFTVTHHNNFINVIDQYESKDDFDNNAESKGFKSCKLAPFACRLKNGAYRFEEKNYQVKKFLMGENAIHGLLYDASFFIVQQYANEENATVVLQHAYRGEDNGYPFHFDCNVTYQLKKDNTLILSTEIINRDKQPIPVQDGWHPYFTLGKTINELELEFQSVAQVVFDYQLVPTGKLDAYSEFVSAKKIGDTFFDNCFTLNLNSIHPLCILRDAENSIQVEIRPDESYPYLQLYTPPHRKSIALENLSAPPDAFNNGIDLIVLPPEGKASFTTSYKVAAL